MNLTAMSRDNVTRLIYVSTITDVNGIPIKTGLGGVSDQSIATQHIIAVNPRSEDAGRPSQSPVNCIALARIRFTHVVGEPSGIFPDDFNRIVCAASVEH